MPAILSLTTPINIPNVTRVSLLHYRINESTASVVVQLRPPAAGQDESTQNANGYDIVELTVRDSPEASDRLIANPDANCNKYRAAMVKSPSGVVATAFGNMIAAITNASPKTPVSLKRAILNSLVSDNILPAGTVA